MKQDFLETEISIALVKETFSTELSRQLSLARISSPIAILDGTGINDDLNGCERPVAFPLKAMQDRRAVVVHSLAKWKRIRLKQMEVETGKGILTDMRALRPDEEFTAIHSIYVDQWDWEQRIKSEERSLLKLKQTVTKIYAALKKTEQVVHLSYPGIVPSLPDKITFIHSQELLSRYPDISSKQREDKAAEEYGAVFIIGIGGNLSDGMPHDGRASDYDDWSSTNSDGYSGLNGDIIVWNPTLKCAFELSSMGIRVDPEALSRQLKIRNYTSRPLLPFHNMLLAGELPECIGGGIGQSRLCMFMLKKSHIGEVQVGIWPEETIKKFSETGITLM